MITKNYNKGLLAIWSIDKFRFFFFVFCSAKNTHHWVFHEFLRLFLVSVTYNFIYCVLITPLFNQFLLSKKVKPTTSYIWTHHIFLAQRITKLIHRFTIPQLIPIEIMPKRIDLSISLGDSFSFKKLEQWNNPCFFGIYRGFHLCGDHNYKDPYYKYRCFISPSSSSSLYNIYALILISSYL